MSRGSRTAWAHALGRAAEDFVARYLESEGCAILARRYRCERGEIDLIVKDGSVLAFVEVKARRRGDYGDPIHAVDWRKRRRLVDTARHYLRNEKHPKCECRFDVVSVRISGGKAHATWMRDAFRP
jgi:putative endonuclease